MKTNTKNQIKSVDIFDDEVSLWNLIGGNGLKFLQKIADTYHLIENRNRPFSILLSGRQSGMLYSMCFLRALAMEISQISATLLNPRDGFIEFFTPSNPDRGYIIEDAEYIQLTNETPILQILQTGNFTQYDAHKKSIEYYPVWGTILMTCKDIKEVSSAITKSVDYIVSIEDLSRCQIIGIIKMRLKWSCVKYGNERVIDMLATGNSVRMIISVLKIAIIEMLAEGRSCLTAQDVVKARECL